tara:strand:- start:64037 stop:64498 length:462 start_codon:yes stop_codon:yes gene_type:complete
MFKHYVLTILVLSMSSYSLAFAGNTDYTQVGRYSTEQNGALLSQQDPLQTPFQVTFPSTVQTIGDAMTYLLSNTGYNLVDTSYRTATAKALFGQSLPLADRHFGPMTVMQGLSALSGSTYQLLIDPAHRDISFQLKKPYQQLYAEKKQQWEWQ